ncbi:NAD(P) transhydrogenase subunit beta [hydrothermal vent metagenome]|uniref:NAD(P) transhydrogenase subunit beta n=1 Tax=hydrothermal vent metagenome TaxID=652676 RepID=A0A3B1ADF7_9ZZZZ
MSEQLPLLYLISAALFILGLKGLTSPASARRGNYFAMAGMLLAITATLLNPAVTSYGFILAGIVVGGAIGTSIALKIKMTAMPQLVAILHSFVGLAAVLVAIGTYANRAELGALTTVLKWEIFAAILIGAITFTGSLVAFGKLQAILSPRAVSFKGRHILNLVLVVAMVGFGTDFVLNNSMPSMIIMTTCALALGFMLVIAIGGADMPVVVSMLNSYSGWAAAATGFTLQNHLLIITGALVGFSGAILSYIMSKAMNRSIVSVIFGGFGNTASTQDMGMTGDQTVNPAAIEDAVFMLENASNVIIVPGYGMAVAQAQLALSGLLESLADKDVNVSFAIHPVAGRMPGHMNVLLAEADVPYDSVVEMDEINPRFSGTDVVLIVGANDVTNPAAKTDESSPIYGMPILDVNKAKQVFVIKRSMKPGYAGIDNQLYFNDNCSMIFGDAKEVCEGLVSQLKAA